MSRPTHPEIAIVGGGPAGLAAAEVAAGAGCTVTVYDRMPSLGRKLLMAGRGGLNLTHSEALPAFLGRYHPTSAPLHAAIGAFPPDALRAWCEGLGEATFVGSSGRVFPRTFKSSPLLRAWLARLADLGVATATRHRLVGCGPARLEFETPAGTTTVRPQAIVLALGGASWGRLGSDGAWVSFLESAEISIAPLAAANVGFSVAWSDHFASRFAGTPLKRIGFRLGPDNVRGEAMVTRDGIEGGAIYALSRPLRERIESDGEAVLRLDLRPDLDHAALAGRLTKRKSGESVATWLRKGAGLPPVAASLLREAHGLSLPHEPRRLADVIKSVPLRLGSVGSIDRAISTAGGVRFAALDQAFMAKGRPGTFFAGEMLDWEAPTGGYLLQASIATGRAAASGALAWLSGKSRDDDPDG